MEILIDHQVNNLPPPSIQNYRESININISYNLISNTIDKIIYSIVNYIIDYQHGIDHEHERYTLIIYYTICYLLIIREITKIIYIYNEKIITQLAYITFSFIFLQIIYSGIQDIIRRIRCCNCPRIFNRAMRLITIMNNLCGFFVFWRIISKY